MSGQRKEYTPEMQANVSASWIGDVGEGLVLAASVDLSYMDDYLFAANLDPRAKQDAATQVSARVAIRDSEGAWEVALLGRNLTDEKVINLGGNTPLGGTLTGGGGNSYFAFVNRPLSHLEISRATEGHEIFQGTCLRSSRHQHRHWIRLGPAGSRRATEGRNGSRQTGRRLGNGCSKTGSIPPFWEVTTGCRGCRCCRCCA